MIRCRGRLPGGLFFCICATAPEEKSFNPIPGECLTATIAADSWQLLHKCRTARAHCGYIYRLKEPGSAKSHFVALF